MHSNIAGLLGGAFLVFATAAHGACAPDRVELRDEGVQVAFEVEVADDPDERAQGLMFRESMPQFSGMLFVYDDTPRQRSFWMRNTLIPLDMLFVAPDGTVEHIHSNAVPLDETPIPSRSDNVTAVLEINGGMAEMLGISPGAELRHPAFAAADPAWPCTE